jgi:branched-chain amino acid aminotransferase
MPPTFPVQRTRTPRPHPPDGELKFGRFFSDHMFLLEWEEGGGWKNPRFAPFGDLAVSPGAAGIHYGQSLFDGLKAFRGADGKLRVFRLDRHAARMAEGAKRLCMPSIDIELFRQAVTEFCHLEREWVPSSPGTALYIRPTQFATEPFLGVRPATTYQFFIIGSPVGAYYGGESLAPVRIRIEDKYVRAAPGGLGAVKAAANYAASLRAAEDARARGYDQVLWTEAHGHSAIEEAGTMNVFVHIDDEIATPALDGTILAGVTRDSVIALLRRWGLPVRQGRITMEQILEARRTGRLREMWGSGTASGVAAIGELGWRGERIVVGDGGEGPLARRLGTALLEIQTGAAPDPDGWMTELPADGAGG